MTLRIINRSKQRVDFWSDGDPVTVTLRLDGVGAVIVDSRNRVWTSRRLEGHVHPVHPPTDAL